jgi:ABC-2 type transport system permease protein
MCPSDTPARHHRRHLSHRDHADRLAVVRPGDPLTYQTDILRALMLSGGHSTSGLPLDFAVLTGSLVILVAIAARLYPRVVL